MRIRKHFLSFSAATPPPSSDRQGGDHHRNHNQPLLLVQQEEVHPNGNQRVLHDNTQSQPSDPPPNHCHHPIPSSSSDHTTQIGLQPSTWVSSGGRSEPKEPIVFPHKEPKDERKREIIRNNNDTGRKESILYSEASSNASTTSLPPPTTAHLVLKGWLEGDRLIPIKKRRGSFGKRVNHDLEEENEMNEGTMKPKPKKNDRCMGTLEVSATSLKNKKNGRRGNVIMEGSRCSRVNGRGWRCCQQTLVGYSLCEHHLGKGRLRSMTSVRGRAQKVAPKEQETKERQDKEVEMILMDHHEFEDDDEGEFNDREEESVSSVEGTKKISKKNKLGVVKARSLSSLLSQIGS